MKIGSGFPFNVIVALITVFLYSAPDYSPENHKVFAFLPFLLPVFLLLNFLYFIYWGLKLNFKLVLSFIVLLLGYKYIERSVSYNLGHKKVGKTIEVLSYNVRVFNVYPHLRKNNPDDSQKMISWVASQKADVKCLQEFYTDTSDEYNTLKMIADSAPYVYFEPFLVTDKVHKFGMVIFSKLPIINKGYLKFKKQSNNQAIFADLVMDGDTIRVYNFHLQSNNIDEGLFGDDIRWKKNLWISLKKYAIASQVRGEQVNILCAHIDSSPYPVIACGDLNEIPYGYVYEQLRRRLNNSFEEGGTGLGITFNGSIPFLRIDNQFFDDRFKINFFSTIKVVKYSDHFPLLGNYLIN